MAPPLLMENTVQGRLVCEPGDGKLPARHIEPSLWRESIVQGIGLVFVVGFTARYIELPLMRENTVR
jgi:hypothetical protein